MSPRKRNRKRNRKGKRRSYGRRKKKTSMTRWGVGKYNIHQFRRFSRGYNVPLTSNLTGFDATAFQFTLDRVQGYSELTAMYDQYRIDYVQFRINWSPKYTVSVDPNAPGQSTYPLLYYYKDYDDATDPTSLAQMQERGNLRQVRITPNKIIKINVKPAVAQMVYQSAVSTAYAPKWGAKIDVAMPDVPHYGLKIGIDHLINQPAQGQLDVEIVYHVTMFGVR